LGNQNKPRQQLLLETKRQRRLVAVNLMKQNVEG
jgi:hypothetical protein